MTDQSTAAAAAPAVTDEQLAALGLTRDDYNEWQARKAARVTAQPYAGPAGAGQLAAPLPPPPAPEPPKAADTPHPEETFAPGELATYEYQHPQDKPGQTRQQIVMVTHVDDTHVHGLVMGEVRNVASFLKGQLGRGHDPAAAAE